MEIGVEMEVTVVLLIICTSGYELGNFPGKVILKIFRYLFIGIV